LSEREKIHDSQTMYAKGSIIPLTTSRMKREQRTLP
jgi:hypothetical protein